MCRWTLSFIPGYRFPVFQSVLDHCQVTICFPSGTRCGSPAPPWSRSCSHTGFQGHGWRRAARPSVIACWNWDPVLCPTLERGDGAGTERRAAAQRGRVTQSHHSVVESSFCRCPWNRCLQSPTIERDLNVGRSTRTYVFEKQWRLCSSLETPSHIWPNGGFARRTHGLGDQESLSGRWLLSPKPFPSFVSPRFKNF